MSYNIQVWTVFPVSLPVMLPNRDTWKSIGRDWIHETPEWQVSVRASIEVVGQDLPRNVDRTLPGIAYLTQLALDPEDASQEGIDFLVKVANRLSVSAHGVFLDLHTDHLSIPSSIKRYRQAEKEERFSTLQFHWWFTQSPLQTEEGLTAFVELLQHNFPEAMPRQYGLFDPPEFHFEETGKEHFINFMLGHLEDVIIWYPSPPVLEVFLYCSSKWGGSSQGFRANLVRFVLEEQVLDQPGWETQLQRFWNTASQHIQPFYGDVRTLEGYLRMDHYFGSDEKTQTHPTRSIWWNGIPQRLGHAAVLGKPYTDLWPTFLQKARIDGELAYLSLDSWKQKRDLTEESGKIPYAIAQPPAIAASASSTHSNDRKYPPVWPFGSPFDVTDRRT
jgi:hypothetical protein